MSLDLFEVYTRGFLTGCGGSLTELELQMLPIGAKMMTLECGTRFLADHLNGDVYFRIHRENHNLDRCRTQFKLVADMESKMDQMAEIVRQVREISRFPTSEISKKDAVSEETASFLRLCAAPTPISP